MCEPASFVVTQTGVLWCRGSESHEDIITENHLNDKTDPPDLVRVEITPPEADYRLPLREWRYGTDQDILPTWYSAAETEVAVRKVLPDWLAAKVVLPDETRDEIAGGAHVVVVYGCVGRIYGSAKVDRIYESATVGRIYGSAKVGDIYESAKVGDIGGSATVGYIHGSATVGYIYESAKVGDIYESAKVGDIHESAKVGSIGGSAKVDRIHGSATVGYIYESAKVGDIYESAKVGDIHESAKVGRDERKG